MPYFRSRGLAALEQFAVYNYSAANARAQRDKNAVFISAARADLSEIIQYIYDNSAQNLSLDSLARQFNYDPISLSHIFSLYIKTDIKNFINNIRIQNYLDLKSLPTNKDKSVIELAMPCGFSNTATFYRAYKKATEE